jgi:hypothetical protein
VRRPPPSWPPGTDGTTPFTRTRQSGDDLYVCPEGAVEELFNVTGLIRRGYDDARTDTLPLIAALTPMATRSPRS